MSLTNAFEAAFHSFNRLSSRPWVVNSCPILLFGDLDGYRSSTLRIVTVGLNPSFQEFPEDSLYRRFPALDGIAKPSPEVYFGAMSDYFRIDPYSSWFDSSFRSILAGLGASFDGSLESTALHTDICSPLATKRTWSQLNIAEREELTEDGVQIWHELISDLKPHIVLISVAREHLKRINFKPITDWKTAHKFENTKNGAPRNPPYEIKFATYLVGDIETMFVFGRAAQTPFGLIGNEQGYETGQKIRELVSSRQVIPALFSFHTRGKNTLQGKEISLLGGTTI